MMTSQRNGIETHVQDSGHQIQPQGDQPANNIPTYYISKNSRTCDIFYSCKKNSFYRKITDSNNQSEKGWTISEESNCFTNYCFFQYRPFKLRVKDNQGEKYLGERSKNVCCQDTLMEIKKQNAEGKTEYKVGKILTINSLFEKECKDSLIYSKPLIRIHKENQQVFVITLAKTSFMNYYLRQCCIPSRVTEYEIYQKKEKSSQIGNIIYTFSSCLKECCTRVDKFSINMTELVNQDIEALLMFGCQQLYYQQYEQMINFF